jgi:hypothetical protein
MISAKHTASAREAALLRTRHSGKFAAGSRPLAERLWARVDRNGPLPEHAAHLGNCWIWWGATNERGYGLIGLGVPKKNARVHRLVWELEFGAVPAGEFVLHKCDQRTCCNPVHLFLGSSQDNTDDMFEKRRNLHKGEARPAAPRLTEEQVATIRHARASGEPVYRFMREFQVNASTVYRVANTTGKRWW